MTTNKQTYELTLNRWHKIRERLGAKSVELANQIRAAYCQTRVDGFAGASQVELLNQRVKSAEQDLETHGSILEAIEAIRSALSKANARVGVDRILAHQETINRRSKLFREILSAQTPDMVPADSLAEYKPFSEKGQNHFYRDDAQLGAIPVRTLSADLAEQFVKQLDTLQTELYSCADQVSDLNREKISIELSESAAKAAGL